MPDPRELVLISWGDIRMFASAISWDGGQTQVVHELAVGDVHPVQPRGLRPRRTHLNLEFDDIPGSRESGLQAFLRLQTAVDNKEVRIFVNPLGASFQARVGDFHPVFDENSVMSAEIEFIPDGDVTQISPAGAAATSVSGQGFVSSAADALDQALEDTDLGFPTDRLSHFNFSLPIRENINLAFSVDLTADVSLSASAALAGSATGSASAAAAAAAFADVYASAFASAQANALAQATAMAGDSAFALAYATANLTADARATVQAWTDAEDLTTRQVTSDVARLSDGISSLIDTAGLEDDLRLWPAMKSAIMLGGAIRSAAIAATSETPSVFVMRIKTRTALLPLAAKIYGGAQAQTRERQIRLLNDIATPGWIDPGDYLMPARSSR